MLTATRYLYLTRHGEAAPGEGGGGSGGVEDAESGLTAAGRRQAALLGERLRGVPLAAIHHGPLPRAAQTARLVAEQLDGVPLHISEAAGDYAPYVPDPAELSPWSIERTSRLLEQFSAAERERGPRLAREALARFTGPVEGGTARHELVVTHTYLIGWLARAAQDAPKWRWLSLAHGNAALTIIRYVPGRPAALLVYNDMGHLPPVLRWTGFPATPALV